MIVRVCTAAALCVLTSLGVTAAAQAKVTPAVSLETNAGGTRIVVVLASTKPLATSKRPKRVSAVAGGTTYKLTRAAGKVTATKLGTWKSKKTTGAEATKLQGLAGKGISVKITPRKGKASTLSASLPAPAATPAPSPTPSPGAATPVPGQTASGAKITPTRDDAAGQAALANGDLALERYKFGSTGQTADYTRIWFYAGGQWRINTIAWNSVSGESCTDVKTGTWVFKEGYTFPEAGGGVIAKLTLAGQVNGDEILVFGAAEPNNVYVGQQLIQFERNPQMQQNC